MSIKIDINVNKKTTNVNSLEIFILKIIFKIKKHKINAKKIKNFKELFRLR